MIQVEEIWVDKKKINIFFLLLAIHLFLNFSFEDNAKTRPYRDDSVFNNGCYIFFLQHPDDRYRKMEEKENPVAVKLNKKRKCRYLH